MQTGQDTVAPDSPIIHFRSGYTIPDQPPFDAEGNRYFHERIRQTRVYLEYGCGAATIHAAQHAQLLCTIDSDAWFLHAVRRKLAEQPRRARCDLLHAEIGRMRKWGVRGRSNPSSDVPQGWRSYSWAPWQRLWQHGAVPDTILVAGRFRVACALTSLIHLRVDCGNELLVDDYACRPHYHVLEQCANLAAMHGRMAVFRVNPAMSLASLDAVLRRYEADWR